MDPATHESILSVKSKRRNSGNVCVNYIQTAAQAVTPSQDAAYDYAALQSPPLKRSKTSQPSRDLQSPTSASMVPSFSTPYYGAVNMAQQPDPSVPRHFTQPQMQSVLPYRISQEDLQDLNEMGFDSIAIEPEQYLRSRGYDDSNQLLLSVNNMQSFPIGIIQTGLASASYSIPSTCGSLTEGTTFDAAMSGRLSDEYNDNVSVPVDMAHVDSQGSYLGRHGIHDESALDMGYNRSMGAELSLGKAYFGSDDDVRGAGSKYLPTCQNGHGQRSASGPVPQVMEKTESVNTYSSLDLNPSPEVDMFAISDYGSSHPFSAEMERSISATSARSNLSIRAKTSLRRQLDNASKIQIQPKMSAPPLKPIVNTFVPKLSDPSNAAQDAGAGDGSINNGKVEIDRTKRERPKSKKLFCDLCTQCPAGFRGEHELRRHRNSKHATTFKRWVCRDPRKDNVATSVEVVRPLSDCKHCCEGKTYGIYYNAAAHLRRTHFKEKPARKGTSNTLSNTNNNSIIDGDASCESPTMAELKKWMVEITVSGDQVTEAGGTDEGEDDDDDSNEDREAQVNEKAYDTLEGSVSSNMSEDENYSLFGMGFAFPSDTSATVTAMIARAGGVDRGAAAHSTDLQAEIHRLDSFHHQAMYSQGGPISSANFLEQQSNATNHLFPELAGFDSSDIVSSPSGTTVTQGTAHPFNADQHFDVTRFDYPQPFGTGDSLEFDFLSLNCAI